MLREAGNVTAAMLVYDQLRRKGMIKKKKLRRKGLSIHMNLQNKVEMVNRIIIVVASSAISGTKTGFTKDQIACCCSM